MTQLPTNGYLRLSQIIGLKRNGICLPALIPVSKSTWWAGVRDGRFPKPVKIGPRCTAWRADDIRELLQKLGTEG